MERGINYNFLLSEINDFFWMQSQPVYGGVSPIFSTHFNKKKLLQISGQLGV
jgi:hypothetical protein